MSLFANSEDQDEMQHNAAFHQGLHCFHLSKYKCSADPDTAAIHLGLHYLPKYPSRDFQYTTGLKDKAQPSMDECMNAHTFNDLPLPC